MANIVVMNRCGMLVVKKSIIDVEDSFETSVPIESVYNVGIIRYKNGTFGLRVLADGVVAIVAGPVGDINMALNKVKDVTDILGWK